MHWNCTECIGLHQGVGGRTGGRAQHREECCSQKEEERMRSLQETEKGPGRLENREQRAKCTKKRQKRVDPEPAGPCGLLHLSSVQWEGPEGFEG